MICFCIKIYKPYIVIFNAVRKLPLLYDTVKLFLKQILEPVQHTEYMTDKCTVKSNATMNNIYIASVMYNYIHLQ